jgi:type II secretory pathway component GspD/PulD (secretin)
LGDLPFIGKLFQHKSSKVNTTDLIIEITPHVVDFAEESQEEFDIDERLERKLIKRKNPEEIQE